MSINTADAEKPLIPLRPRIRKLVLVVAGGVLLAAAAVTVGNAFPRPVSIVVLVAANGPEPAELHVTITSEERVIVEATERVLSPSGRFEYRFWIAPGPHRLALRMQGCREIVRRFDPKERDRLYVRYDGC